MVSPPELRSGGVEGIIDAMAEDNVVMENRRVGDSLWCNVSIKTYKPTCFAWKGDIPPKWNPTNFYGDIFYSHVLAKIIKPSVGTAQFLNYLIEGIIVGNPGSPS